MLKITDNTRVCRNYFVLFQKNKKKLLEQKAKVKACKKPLFWNANCDRENKDYPNALSPRRFNASVN